jgi:hypothetical protein
VVVEVAAVVEALTLNNAFAQQLRNEPEKLRK